VKLTAEQRAALDALPPKRRAFVLAYCGESACNGSDAARRAGYAKPGEEAHRLLKNAHVVRAVDALRTPVEEASVLSCSRLI
jgi:phage terminase small subunit